MKLSYFFWGIIAVLLIIFVIMGIIVSYPELVKQATRDCQNEYGKDSYAFEKGGFFYCHLSPDSFIKLER